MLKDEDFLVELFALVDLCNILCLYDTLGTNHRNYGIIKNVLKGGNIKYEPTLIDHLS